MGFLLGTFGTISAGRLVRQLQSQMFKITNRRNRVTRDIQRMSDNLKRAQQRELNNLNLFSNSTYMAAQQQLYQTTGLGALQAKWAQGGQLTAEEQQAFNQQSSMISQNLSMMKAQNEQMVASMKQQIEDKYQALEEQMLEPLRDEEDLLTTQQDSLQARLEVAKEDYKACKAMAKEDAKNLTPSYTGISQG
mgnify:FL=1